MLVANTCTVNLLPLALWESEDWEVKFGSHNNNNNVSFQIQ